MPSMENEVELLPCPFCGLHPTGNDKGTFKKPAYSPMVHLSHWCGDKARKVEIALSTAEAVRRVWNTRVTPAQGWQSIDINTNDTTTVNLTPKGLEIWMAHWEHNPYASATPPPNNVVTTELWNLAHIFGPHLFNGCKIPFVENKITIRREPALEGANEVTWP